MDLQKVVKLTSSQYAILASGGTVGSYTGLNSSYLYMVEDSTQYIPLAGTTSLYGSIVPYGSAVTLGTNNSRFQSIYAGFMSVSSIWTQGVSWPGNIYVTANTAVVGGGGTGTLYLNAGEYVSTTASSIYTKAYKDLSIYASSSIFIGASKNLELRADGNGMAFLYGSQAVKIAAGEGMGRISALVTPAISMWLSGGYCPMIDMNANYSGYGNIYLNAGDTVNIYGDNNMYLTTASYGAIDVFCQSGKFMFRSHPVVAGWQHNIVVTHADQGTNTYAGYAFTLQITLPVSTAITNLNTLASYIYDLGFSFNVDVSKAKVYPACGYMNLGAASTSAGAYHRHIIGVTAQGTSLRPAIVRPAASSRITYGFDAVLDGATYTNPASVYDTVITLQ